MPPISRSIPNLVNGVSQQPASLRLDSQGEIQVNGYSSVVEGLKKRPPTRNLAKLIAGTLANGAHVHVINRDTAERYIVVTTDENIQVFDLLGDEKTVNIANGADAYLNTSFPQGDFRMVSVADFTFIVNKTITPAMANTNTGAPASEGLIYVRQGNFATAYKVVVDDVEEASYTTSNTDITDIQTDNIAEQLKTQAESGLGAGWTVSREGSTVRIVKDDGTAFKLKATDSNGDRNTVVVKEQIQRFSDLPNVAPDGFKMKITGEPGANADDYYVEFETQDAGTAFGRGIWKETVAPAVSFEFDPATMPHQLVRQANGEFDFGPATWEDREVGDAESNPEPSFIGVPINDVYFYRNRLGFAADENAVMSRTGEYFNFWRRSIPAGLLDDDPIDVAIPHTKVSIIRHAVPISKQLILFSDQTQFVAKHGDLLTPKTIGFDQTTEFENNPLARPVGSGRNLYFATPKGGFSGIREYFVDQDTNADDAADVTAHVPAFIPANVFKLAAATNEDLLVALSSDEPSSIFVYKFYWNGNEKLQSSWSKWTFGSGVEILDAGFIDTDLFFVIQREDGVYLEVMGVEPNRLDEGFEHEVLLDRRIIETGIVTYSAVTDLTTWTLPFAESGDLQVVTRDGGAEPNGVVLNVTKMSPTVLTLLGDWTAQPVYIGKKFTFLYQFSTTVLKQRQANGAEAPITTGRLQVLRYTLNFSKTGYFRVEVTPQFNDTFIYAFTGRVVGAGSNVIGQPALHTGAFNFPVRSKNDRVTIELKNDSFLPSLIQSAEWEALYTPRSTRA